MLDDEESIATFSKTYAVREVLVRKYLEHLHYLNFKKAKHADVKRKKKEPQSRMTYDNYNWVEMFHTRTLNKLTVPVLDLFLERCSLARKRMNKKQKIQVITACLANSEVNLDQNRQNGDIDRTNGEDDDGAGDEGPDSSDTDNIEDGTSGFDDNKHVVLCEVGHSSTDEDSEGEISDQVFSVNTRSGRLATTYQTRQFFGD